MVMSIRTFALAAGFALGATGMAAAAPITVELFKLNKYQAYVNSLAAGRVVEDFEKLGGTGPQREVGGVGAPLATAVGGIQTLGGKGTGASVFKIDPTAPVAPPSQGTTLALRNVANNFGRVNTTSPGTWFLDSNDTFGMTWAVNIGKAFNQIAFTLSDASDAGARLEIKAPGQDAVTPFVFDSGQANGIVNLVIVTFSGMVESATLTLTNRNQNRLKQLTGTRLNDGFAIDDLTVGTIAAVPLPAGALLLLTAMGGFAVARSRRKAA